MAKKTFKNNPAMQFISPVEAVVVEAEMVAEEPFVQPVSFARQAQTKSRRVQLLMQPQLHDRLKEIARARGVSLNDLVHTVMEDFARDVAE